MAESLVFVDPSLLPFLFDDGLLAALDNGIDADRLAALVADYLLTGGTVKKNLVLMSF